MNLTPRQIEILTAHAGGGLPFVAKGSGVERGLLAGGLLSFNHQKTMTRLTKDGREILKRQAWRAAIAAAAAAGTSP